MVGCGAALIDGIFFTHQWTDRQQVSQYRWAMLQIEHHSRKMYESDCITRPHGPAIMNILLKSLC